MHARFQMFSLFESLLTFFLFRYTEQQLHHYNKKRSHWTKLYNNNDRNSNKFVKFVDLSSFHKDSESDVTRFANQLTLNRFFLQMNRRPIDRSLLCRKCRFGASPSCYSWVFFLCTSATIGIHTNTVYHSVWQSYTIHVNFIRRRARVQTTKKFTYSWHFRWKR